METLRLEEDPPVIKLGYFKTLIKSQFYPIMYGEDQWMQWNYFRKKHGYNVQDYLESPERWP